MKTPLEVVRDLFTRSKKNQQAVVGGRRVLKLSPAYCKLRRALLKLTYEVADQNGEVKGEMAREILTTAGYGGQLVEDWIPAEQIVSLDLVAAMLVVAWRRDGASQRRPDVQASGV